MKNFFKKVDDALVHTSNHLKFLTEKQEILSNVKLAVHTEEKYLEMLARMAELEIEEEIARIKYGELYDEISAKVKSSLKDAKISNNDFQWNNLQWKTIIKPKPSSNDNLQVAVEAEYEEILSNRQNFIKTIKRRCAADGKFKKIFLQKLTEAKYPEIDNFS